MKRLDTQPSAYSITLEPNDARRLASLCGQFDENLRLIEQRLNVEIRSRDNFFAVYGDAQASQAAADIIYNLYQETAHYSELSPEEVHLHLRQQERETPMTQTASNLQATDNVENFSVIRTKKGNIKPRGLNQQRYVRSIQTHDINFGIGPAGTGKTYLAVACAVEALLRDEVERILLVRPAVEAGERLGFLPGKDTKFFSFRSSISGNQSREGTSDAAVGNGVVSNAWVFGLRILHRCRCNSYCSRW